MFAESKVVEVRGTVTEHLEVVEVRTEAGRVKMSSEFEEESRPWVGVKVNW
jgi:hypothetical protein